MTPRRRVRVGPVTGPGTSTEALGVLGADLGVCWRGPDGGWLHAFGDSFRGPGVGQGEWLSPVVLRGRLRPGAPVEFATVDGAPVARQAWRYSHAGGVTWLPTDGITVGATVYLHAMRHQGLGRVVEHAVWRSDDNARSWKVVRRSKQRGSAAGGDPHAEMWTVEHGGDGFVYRFSARFDRSGPLFLHRARAEDFPDARAWQPWGWADGRWRWGNPATPVLEGRYGEMSARWVDGTLVLSYFDAGNYRAVVKFLDTFTSNLYDAPDHVVLDGCGWDDDGADGRQAQLYGIYVHPASTPRSLTFLASQWQTSAPDGWPYRVVQHSYVPGEPDRP